MSCYAHRGSACHSDDTMDDDTDDKDDTKRKSRNLSEKKRRDQFNILVNDLGSMVGTNSRKMDKSTVLKSTISFLKNHNEIAVRSRAHEIQEDWKPSFLTNDEFMHLILEALEGFIIVISSNGLIYYVSESVTSLLGHLPSDLINNTIYEIAHQMDQSLLYNIFLNHNEKNDQYNSNEENQVFFTCQIRRNELDVRDHVVYELVQFVGNFRSDIDICANNLIPKNRAGEPSDMDTKVVFVGTGRLQTPQLIREMSVIDSSKSEFMSRYSLEWKFLFLDHRAPPIIGYLPFEVLGTSGYDYYHVEDLDKVVVCHEALLQKGEGTSCYYRFLTKGQQWIWLQTRFYITYNQWNSKPEFIVCTHRVVSYADVVKEFRKNPQEFGKCEDLDGARSPSDRQQLTSPPHIGSASSSWSTRCPKKSHYDRRTNRPCPHSRPNSDTTSVSAGSQGSAHSRQAPSSVRSKSSSVKNPDAPAATQSIQQSPMNQACIVFPEPFQFVAATPVQPLITTGFTAWAGAVGSSVQTTENLFPQNIPMTSAQHQMKDELQRKYEELQQVIVHKQEEFRRVSEQLLFAKYGIISPLLSSGMPNVTSPCPQTGRCVSSTTNSPLPLISSSGDQGVKVMSVPISLSVPVMSPDLFVHPLSVNTPPTAPGPTHLNGTRLMSTQQQPTHTSSQQQLVAEQPPSSIQEEPPPEELSSFQICEQAELLYAEIESSGNNEHDRPA